MADKDITKQSEADLNKELIGARARLRDLRFDRASGKVSEIKEYRKLRQRVAQILTELRARQLAA